MEVRECGSEVKECGGEECGGEGVTSVEVKECGGEGVWR